MTDVRPPDPQWQAEQHWAVDIGAAHESKEFQRLDQLENMKHATKLRVHWFLGWLVPASITIAFVLFWIGILVYAVHLFTPWGWLEPDQLQNLHTILFSSVVGAIVAQGIKRYLD